MIFALLTFFAAFSIETIGTVVSVIGLSALFGANPIVIALAVALDVGKIVVVTLLYKYWKELGVVMKSYGLIAAFVTMVITSAGAAGYLAGEFQKAILGTQEGSLKVEVLKDEQLKLENRKKQIDDQIANLPANFSRGRVTLMKEFQDEQQRISDRLVAINAELPQLQIAQIGVEAKAGPILYISKAFDIPVEEAVKYVILMIIFVFDPLAVFLIVAGNFLWDQRAGRKKDEELQNELKKFKPEVHGGEFPRLTDQELEDLAAKVQAAAEKYKDANFYPPPNLAVHEFPEIEEPTNVRQSEPVILAADIPSPSADPVDRPAGQTVVPEVTLEELNIEEKQARGVADLAVADSANAPFDQHEESERRAAHAAGMSLEAWREMQLKKLDRLQDGADTIAAALKPREQITLSTLGLQRPESSLTSVRPDNQTIVNEPVRDNEVGYRTGVFITGPKSKS